MARKVEVEQREREVDLSEILYTFHFIDINMILHCDIILQFYSMLL